MRPNRPGVHVERTDASRGEGARLRTDVAGFVGIAERGPLDTPVPVESMRQFAAQFGACTGAGYLAYAVRGFFENGGRRCWCVRVASNDAAHGAQAATTALRDAAGNVVLVLRASSAGSWGNALGIEWSASGRRVATAATADTPHYARVGDTTGFAAGDLVTIEQGAVSATRVIVEVDARARRLYWVHDRPERRGAWDRPLSGFAPALPLRITRIAYALTVRASGRVAAAYADLHLVPEHPRYVGRVLAAVDYDPRRADGVPRAPELVVADAPDDLATGTAPLPLAVTFARTMPLAGGRDGLALLAPRDFVGEPPSPLDGDLARAARRRGVEALADIDEIALLAMPDVLIRPEPDPDYAPRVVPRPDPCRACPAPPEPVAPFVPPPAVELPPVFDDETVSRLQSALLDHCERLGDRFAVLALPEPLATQPSQSRQAVIAWRERYDRRCGALYAPWISVLDPRTTAVRTIPPCGHVLGAIAATDRAHGVFRAPGNVALNGVVAAVRALDDADHGAFNDASINAVRGEFGRPCLVAGARTLSFDPQWRHISVVRLMLTLKKAIELSLRPVVFEPNDAGTRHRVTTTLRGLLGGFHARGAFAGATADTSFFVRCDDDTTTAADRDAGRLIARVGFAPAAPCEFIVLRVGRERNTLTVALDDAAVVAS
ncbi:MAG TPA: phage tail sheath C-terminal domain-containing protein [Tahibacter sp.]|uniref:phage tail sheath family protein n=1 Tax=Tahibacter sp. TaxID=2056211 RepID=UPI002B7A83AB|nr:phage tail sheath C-terminal domain-containing protein [Tahibacter sp.]HSX63066.1 phage tail sheath C-terminal domain-containing protein [Tahibacter sp.]